MPRRRAREQLPGLGNLQCSGAIGPGAIRTAPLLILPHRATTERVPGPLSLNIPILEVDRAPLGARRAHLVERRVLLVGAFLDPPVRLGCPLSGKQLGRPAYCRP